MRAMVRKGDGLELQRVENPKVKEDEVLIKIIAAGVNKCDMLTKANCPGHECSGIINAIGRNVRQWKVGDKVCALLDRGGYAEQVAVPAGQVLPVPADVPIADAAGLPYVACNVWLALSNIQQSYIQELLPGKKTVLINEATTAFGVLAIQVAKYKGFKVIATAGSREGKRLCHDLGADLIINKVEDVTNIAIAETQRGVDIILDYGSSYLQKTHSAIGFGGTILIVDLEGKAKCPAKLGEFHIRNVELKVINIRTQSADEKAAIVAQVRKKIWPTIEEGKVKPGIGRRLPLPAAPVARELLNNEEIFGNVLLYP